MLRSLFASVVPLICLIGPLAAQVPAGWQVYIERSQSVSDPDDVPDLKVIPMGKGFHVTGGPRGTFWNPANRVDGDFRARATFNLMKPSGHVNYYGLVFGGETFEGAAQKYLYFVIGQNGTYTIRARMGNQVQDVQTQTPHSAIRQPGADGRSTNTLEVQVAGNTVSFVVNSTAVHTAPKSGAPSATDGIVGVRVNHQLDVQVDGFEVVRQ